MKKLAYTIVGGKFRVFILTKLRPIAVKKLAYTIVGGKFRENKRAL